MSKLKPLALLCLFAFLAQSRTFAKGAEILPATKILIPQQELHKLVCGQQGLGTPPIVPAIVPGSGGKMAGFRIIQVRPGSEFQRFGLRLGDWIKEVNDVKLTGIEGIAESNLCGKIKSAKKLRLLFERDGKDQVVEVEVVD
ncbi:MAG: hypothetical protein ACXVA9_09470 [Bdellovibrionales bacterium]